MKFTRHAYHRKKKLKPRWRRPRGLHNKQRLERKGATPRVKPGYRSPKATRGKKNGLEIVNVYTESDVEGLDAKTQGVVIGKVGMKKKISLLKLVVKHKLTLLTGDAKQKIAELEQRYEERRTTREEKRQEREQREQERESEAESDAEEEEKSTPLTKVKGVGPSRIESLQEAGIESAEQLAELSVKELSEQAELSETVAKKIIDAARKTVDDEDDEKDKVLTKAR